MKLIIQIPCYNEEDTLEITLNALPKHIDGVDEIEYLMIDDGSSDATEKVALEWGVQYIVHFKRNLGLAKGFLAGIDLALRHGADIIVNTDADNQYCADDIPALIRPILDGKADIVVGERPIEEIESFSPLKKRLQRMGSAVVRAASKTEVPDATSGFRAYSRKAAMRVNVHNEYTYTLETIIQAGRNRMAIVSVPVRINPKLRESRLMGSVFEYIKKSVLAIVRAVLMYKPMQVFTLASMVFLLGGVGIGIRFLVYYVNGNGGGHVQSLILATMMIIVGWQTFMMGLEADIISANRKILEDVQYRVKRLEFELLSPDGKEKDKEKDKEE